MSILTPNASMNSFILYPPALRNHPRFEEMLKAFDSVGTRFEFGFNPDFCMPGHGQKVNDELLKKGQYTMALPTGTVDGPHFSLALFEEDETPRGVQETLLACLIATWAYIGSKNSQTPVVFVSITNADERCVAVLFAILEEMVHYLWMTTSEDEAFMPLKSVSCVGILVHCSVLKKECVEQLLDIGYDFDCKSGMLTKGLVMLA